MGISFMGSIYAYSLPQSRWMAKFAPLSCLKLKSKSGGLGMNGVASSKTFKTATQLPSKSKKPSPRKTLMVDLLALLAFWFPPASAQPWRTSPSSWWMMAVRLETLSWQRPKWSMGGLVWMSNASHSQRWWYLMVAPTSRIRLVMRLFGLYFIIMFLILLSQPWKIIMIMHQVYVSW